MIMKRFLLPVIIGILVAVLATEPITSYAQTALTAKDLVALEDLSGQMEGEVKLSGEEKKIWNSLIDNQTLSDKDKRLTNYVLPLLAQKFGEVHVDILKDHATEEQKQSRLLATSTGVSPRYFAKAASITSLGTMTCADPNVLFTREIDPEKTVWLNRQTDSPNNPPFFGRSFDLAARQSFLLPLRSFTNRPTSSQSWSNMLQQIAKGEIEERFDLQPGLLANTPAGELDETIAKGRLARQLGLARLPDFMVASSFYATLGQLQVEQALNLPANSFSSQNDTRFWYETYQNIGFRVLEEQLELPDKDVSISPFPATTALSDLPRFQLLAKRLEDRGSLYKDPVLALGLPTPSYLPTSGGSDIYSRLKNGDPDAFAAAGAYFLGDSLQLSAAAITELVQSTLRGENRAVNLATARPLDAAVKAEQLFSAEMTIGQRQSLFETIGESSKEDLDNHLAQVNGNVLLALTGTAQAPTESGIVTLFEDHNRLQNVLATLAQKSQADTDYGDGLTAAALQRRGEELLGQALAIDPADLHRLSEETDSAIVGSIGAKVDQALGWPSLEGQSMSRLFATGKLTDQQLLENGINRLWGLFSLPESIKTSLNNMFLSDAAETVTTTPDTPSTQAPSEDNQVTDDQTSDEVVSFAIPSDALSLSESLTIVTGIDATNQVPLLTGRFNTGLKILTLSQLAKAQSNGSTLTISKLIDLYSRPTQELAESITAQTDAGFNNDFFSQDMFESIKNAAAGKQIETIWPAIENEIIRQWNIGCPLTKEAAINAIDRLLEQTMTWPETTNDPTETATQPVQIFALSSETIAKDVKASIDEKYPAQTGSKVGLFANPRDWDDIYIGY
jgi:hypothetical protein